MKLYLSGWESELVERALMELSCTKEEDREHVDRLLERMEKCKTLQKHN